MANPHSGAVQAKVYRIFRSIEPGVVDSCGDNVFDTLAWQGSR
jgi:hypothetical protein